MSKVNFFILNLLFLFAIPCFGYAGFPGECNRIFYTNNGPFTSYTPAYLNSVVTQNASTGLLSASAPVLSPAGATRYNITLQPFYFESGSWHSLGSLNQNFPTSIPLADAILMDDLLLTTINSAYPSCPTACTAKKGQVNYSLAQHSVGETYSAQTVCYDGCQQSTAAVWEDCVNSSCVTSVKYTYTGNSCTDEPGLGHVQPTPPTRCTDQIGDLITQCGGSLNVQSFDFETCTGSCTPDSCQSQWSALVTRCGGFMAISSWDKTTCSGTCASDPMPNDPSPTEKPPEDIKQTETKNPDGSKEVTKTTTYTNQSDNYTYENKTTTYYDSSGAQTGQSSTTTRISGDSGSSSNNESVVAPSGDIYTKKNDLSGGLASRINYQQVIDATSELKNTFLYQVPHALLSLLDRVKGQGCEYPPKIIIDFHNAFTSDPIVISFAPFESIVVVMKFFFALLCLFMTFKSVMYLFD